MMAVPVAKRRRYMLAAATIRTHSIREAAILGAITDSAVNYGRLDVEFVRLPNGRTPPPTRERRPSPTREGRDRDGTHPVRA